MDKVSGTHSSGITAFWTIKNQIYFLLTLMSFLGCKLRKNICLFQVHGRSFYQNGTSGSVAFVKTHEGIPKRRGPGSLRTAVCGGGGLLPV